MPLHGGKGKEVVSENIREMMHSDTFAKGKSRKKKNLMAVAAALSKARGGKPRPDKVEKKYPDSKYPPKNSLTKDAMKK